MTRLLLLAALVATPAAAEQFDLVCKGERRWAEGGAAEPFAARYRVDTTAAKWCRDDCATVEPLAGTAGGKLLLKGKAEGEEQYEESVTRPGGVWVDRYKGPYPPGDFWQAGGTCTDAPFTALPVR